MTALAEGLEAVYRKKETSKDNPKITDLSNNGMSVSTRS